MLSPAQVDTVVNAVVAKADSSIANRVTARKGDAADIDTVRKAVAKALTAKVTRGLKAA